MTLAVEPKPYAAPDEVAKRVGLVVRVSTDRQAANDEGSLKTQLQRLRRHIEYKREACGETWAEAGVYELRAVSGKDSVRSEEFQRLYADIRAGRVNVIAATAMDRVTRSVKDFITLFEFLQEHGVEFVSLKEQCDTSTPVGRLFATMIMALAQFERENTAERTRDATAARAERGLWNGGRILGYDPDPQNRSTLIPNTDEATIVNCAFDTYLDCGSVKETVETLNRRGFRTKVYTSRRNKQHSGKEFSVAAVQQILKNRAYVGQKEVNKRKGSKSSEYQVVDAAWPAIVDRQKFEDVQRLLAANSRCRHNETKPIRHVHVLGGLLACGRCGNSMQGRSGTGRSGTRYYYYVCTNAECGLRVAAEEVEGAILDQIGEMARSEAVLERLVTETNTRLQRQKPTLARQQRVLQRSLDAVNAEAGKLLSEWSAYQGNEGHAFVSERLNELAGRRTDIERGLKEVEQAVRQLQDQAISAEGVRKALADVRQVYDHLTPFEQRDLMRLVVHRAEVKDREIALEIYGGVCAVAQNPQALLEGSSRFGRQVWLPGQDSNLQPSG